MVRFPRTRRGARRHRPGDRNGVRAHARSRSGIRAVTMKLSGTIAILTGVLLATDAAAPGSLTPPGLGPPPPSKAPAQPPAAKPPAKKPPAAPTPAAPEAKPGIPILPNAITAPTPDDPNADLVYGAFQRGQYKTSFDLATKRAQAGDAKAMTMLGELYANAFGVKRDYGKALEWYKRASNAGDRAAMFALAMMSLSGRGVPTDKQEAVKLLASSAKLGEPKA